jgi:hypothetical protein
MIQRFSRRRLMELGAAAGAATLLPSTVLAARRQAPVLQLLSDTGRDGVLVWDVSPVGYIAEEYVLSGEADVLESVTMADAVDMSKRNAEADLARRTFERTIVSPAQPYATRLIVYRPAKAERFSGRVLMEVLHPSNGGSSIVWGQSHALLASRGDAYIGVQPPLTIDGLKRTAPSSAVGRRGESSLPAIPTRASRRRRSRISIMTALARRLAVQ